MLRRTHGAAPALVVIGTLIGVLGFAAPGCSDRACFLWQNSQGVCPDQRGATKFFGACSNIETVDGPGSFEEGKLCCYDITRSLSDLPCQPMEPNHSHGPGSHSSEFSSARTSVGSAGGGNTTFDGTGGSTMTGFGGGGSGGAPACDQLTCGFTSLHETISGCVTCASANECADESTACDEAMSCNDYRTCIASCSSIQDTACIQACANGDPVGAMIFTDWMNCLVCIGCPTACEANPIKLLSTCDDGAGGAGGAGGMSMP